MAAAAHVICPIVDDHIIEDIKTNISPHMWYDSGTICVYSQASLGSHGRDYEHRFAQFPASRSDTQKDVSISPEHHKSLTP